MTILLYVFGREILHLEIGVNPPPGTDDPGDFLSVPVGFSWHERTGPIREPGWDAE